MKVRLFAVLVTLAFVATGCLYGGVAAVGTDTVVITKTAGPFGLMRTVYVCKVTPNGLTGCKDKESP